MKESTRLSFIKAVVSISALDAGKSITTPALTPGARSPAINIGG